MHVSRRYRACATRCAEILDNIKETSQVEPAYLMYLHFYAAASMEMCTRPLPLTSPYRTDLLRQASSHYEQAASLVQAAEDSVAARTRSGSASSTHSSCHSPYGSVSSRTWTADTSLSSPTNSVCSFDDLATKSQSSPHRTLKRIKKVSFSLPKEEETFRIPEPLIRPDSPTLGFDDEYFHAGAALKTLPEPPRPKLIAEELPLVPEDGPLGVNQDEEEDDDDPFPVERSVHRYNEHLSSLRAQLASHSAHLATLLAGGGGSASPPQAETSVPLLPLSLLPLPRPRRDSVGVDPRALDKQARIDRLRRSGWQRKRFDARRYEDLCEAVMAELS